MKRKKKFQVPVTKNDHIHMKVEKAVKGEREDLAKAINKNLTVTHDIAIDILKEVKQIVENGEAETRTVDSLTSIRGILKG